MTRRDLLRVGGAACLAFARWPLRLQARAESGNLAGGPGWGTAKNIVLVYLQEAPAISICGIRRRTCLIT
jgi:hypothetical protein